MRSRCGRWMGLAAVVAGVVGAAAGPAIAQLEPIKWSAVVPPGAAKVRVGQEFKVEVVAAIEDGWHLYSVTQPKPPIATRVRLAAGQPFEPAGPVEPPVPETGFDPNFNINVEYYEKQARFVLPVRVSTAARPGPTRVVAEAYFQGCDAKMCLPPQTVRMDAPLEIVEGESAAASRPLPAPAGAPSVAMPGAAAGPGATAPLQARQKPDGAAPAAPALSSGTPVVSSAPAGSPASPQVPSATAPVSAAAPMTAAPLTARESASRTTPAGAPAASAAAPPGSFPAFIWLAMTMGALSLLTPCVFPMIPITISYFTSQAAGSRTKALSQALTYMAGIVLTFTALGMAMALLVGATSLNRFASSPWINLLLGALFVGFALSLFGFFEIRLPSGLLSRLDAATRQSGGGRTIGTLLMALTFTLTSFTCTAPFIGTLLVMAAGGDWQWPLVGMLAFSVVFAFPFFVLALAPQLVASLPRSGGWMNSVKVMMGFLVVAASTKFLANADVVWGWGLLTHDVVLGSWVAIALLMMVYVLGMFRFEYDSPVAHVGLPRLAIALGCGTLAFWLASGLAGKSLGEIDALLPLASVAPRAAAGAASDGELTWLVNDYGGAAAEARRIGRRLFLDFTGYTCTNCKWMETNMFPRPDVRRELERYVRVRLYTDGDGELYRQQQRFQQETFRTIAVPFYAIVEADGTPVATFAGLTRDEKEFIGFLRHVPGG